jgi:acetyl esterase
VSPANGFEDSSSSEEPMRIHIGARTVAALSLALGVAGATVPHPATAQTTLLEQDVQFGTAASVPLMMDVYGPGDGEVHPAIVMMHPGGFVGGDKADPDLVRVADFYAQNGFVVFSIDYRSARDGHPYPAQVEDARQAVAFIRSNAGRFDADPDRIGAFGASAGGTLAASIGMEGEGPLHEGTRVATVVTWSAALDLLAVAEQSLAEQDGDAAEGLYTYMTGEPGQRTFRGNKPALAAAIEELRPQIEAASPINQVDSTDPPTFIANGPVRDFIPLNQAQTMADTLTQAGVPNELMTPSGGHALAYTDEALEPTLSFLQEHLVPYGSGPLGDGAPGDGLLERVPLWAAAVAAVLVLLVAGYLLTQRRRNAVNREY